MRPRGTGKHLAAMSAGLCALAAVSAQAEPMSAEAYQHATAAYRAIEGKDMERALAEARLAVARQPASAGTRRVLAEVLMNRKQYDLARQVIDGAIQRGVVDGPLYTTRGYLDVAVGQPKDAIVDFQKALDITLDDPEKARFLRLSIADAAISAKEWQAAIDILEPLHDSTSTEVNSRLGQAYFALGKNEEASKAFAAAASDGGTPEQRRSAMKFEAQADRARGATDEARTLAQALASQTEGCDLDLGYILMAAHDDAEALAYFDGPCKSDLTATSHIDAGGAAVRLVKNDDAISHFNSAIDLQNAAPDPKPLTPVQVFDARRETDTLSREWGADANYTYLADRNKGSGGDVSQAMAEVYWQPPDIGYRNGSTFQVFGGVNFNAITPGQSSLSLNGTEGRVGARWKPLGDWNLVLDGEGLFPLASNAYSDFLIRVAYSDGFGTDLDPVNDWWQFGEFYTEGDYFTVHGWEDNYFEARYGLTTYLSSGRPEWTASIFGDGAWVYDSTEQHRFAAGIGPGVGIRYWFRETDYRAPASFAELDLIYRTKLTTSDRDGGLVLELNLNY